MCFGDSYSTAAEFHLSPTPEKVGVLQKLVQNGSIVKKSSSAMLRTTSVCTQEVHVDTNVKGSFHIRECVYVGRLAVLSNIQ